MFSTKLKRLDACSKAVKWVGTRSLEDAWAECHRGDWMLWLSMRMAGEPGWSPREAVILVLCDIVEPAIQRIPAGETRPAAVLAVVRRWCAGETTASELRAADANAAFAADAFAAYAAAAASSYAAAAYAAAAAAYAADAAADAAAYAAAAADAYAAAAAAYAAYAAAAADADATTAEKKQAELIRARLTIGEVDV